MGVPAALPAAAATPRTETRSLAAPAGHVANNWRIVTISRSRQENISDMRYKQWPLISERPRDFKQPDSSRGLGVRAREL